MSRFLGQKKITPKTLIILIVVIGIFLIIYNSKREVKIQTEQASKVDSGNFSSNSAEAVAADQSGKLSDKPFKQETAPGFSFYPPAGWSRVQPAGNVVVEYTSPAEDKVEEGVAWLTVRPNITVFVAQEKFKNLDEAVEASAKQKVKINGEEALMVESIRDISDSVRRTLEIQVKERISTAAGTVSQKEAQKDINEVLQGAKVKLISYSFYKQSLPTDVGKNGYYINVTGKALESFWDKRGPQLKSSLDTFKFE